MDELVAVVGDEVDVVDGPERLDEPATRAIALELNHETGRNWHEYRVSSGCDLDAVAVIQNPVAVGVGIPVRPVVRRVAGVAQRPVVGGHGGVNDDFEPVVHGAVAVVVDEIAGCLDGAGVQGGVGIVTIAAACTAAVDAVAVAVRIDLVAGIAEPVGPAEQLVALAGATVGIGHTFGFGCRSGIFGVGFLGGDDVIRIVGRFRISDDTSVIRLGLGRRSGILFRFRIRLGRIGRLLGGGIPVDLAVAVVVDSVRNLGGARMDTTRGVAAVGVVGHVASGLVAGLGGVRGVAVTVTIRIAVPGVRASSIVVDETVAVVVEAVAVLHGARVHQVVVVVTVLFLTVAVAIVVDDGIGVGVLDRVRGVIRGGGVVGVAGLDSGVVGLAGVDSVGLGGIIDLGRIRDVVSLGCVITVVGDIDTSLGFEGTGIVGGTIHLRLGVTPCKQQSEGKQDLGHVASFVVVLTWNLSPRFTP